MGKERCAVIKGSCWSLRILHRFRLVGHSSRCQVFVQSPQPTSGLGSEKESSDGQACHRTVLSQREISIRGRLDIVTLVGSRILGSSISLPKQPPNYMVTLSLKERSSQLREQVDLLCHCRPKCQ